MSIAKKLAESMATWQIDQRKLLCIIPDNGSNMVKAVKSLSEELSLVDDDELPDADADVQDHDSDMEQVRVMFDSSVEIKRLSCIAHNFSSWCMCSTYSNSLAKEKSIVYSIRVSSVATQKLLAKAGKSLVTDCSTRWSSSFYMVSRLLELKSCIKEVFEELRWDSLLSSGVY